MNNVLGRACRADFCTYDRVTIGVGDGMGDEGIVLGVAVKAKRTPLSHCLRVRMPAISPVAARRGFPAASVLQGRAIHAPSLGRAAR